MCSGCNRWSAIRQSASRWVLCLALMSGAGSPVIAVTFDWAIVGDINNPADTVVMNDGTSGFGSVDYEFQISKTHVTNLQYAEYLNAIDPDGLEYAKELLRQENPGADPTLAPNSLVFNWNMAELPLFPTPLKPARIGGMAVDPSAASGSKYGAQAGKGNQPVVWVNWDKAARFVNWMSNGQGTGDTENGVYDLDYPCGFAGCDPPTRQSGATVFIPSEDEYYKAAYYDPTKNGTGGYWEYGLRSDDPPIVEGPAGGPTSANYRAPGSTYWQTGFGPEDVTLNYFTDVGAYADATSHYGLFDTDSNAYQWTEDGRRTIGSADFPVFRGGSWDNETDQLGRNYRNIFSFSDGPSHVNFGFRVASLVTSTGIDGDFDDNGTYETADIDALVFEIAAGTNGASFDLTGDGVVSIADRDAWLAEAGAAELVSGNAFLIGDQDLDGAVDSTDLGLLLNNFNATSGISYSGGDLNGDSNVDSTDLGLVLNNFNQSAVSVSAVPEPADWTIAMLGLVGLVGCRRRRVAVESRFA